MISQVSPVGAHSPTKGTSGVGQSEPRKDSGAVQSASSPEAPRAAEVSAISGLDGTTSQALDEQAVEEIVEGLNEFAQKIERQLKFSIDEDSGRTVITVIDAATKEVVRQIPTDEVLALQKRLGEVKGLLFRTEA